MNPTLLRTAVLSLIIFFAWVLAPLPAAESQGSDSLAQGFRSPPVATKPWCYWYWISDNISKEGISRDLESMARVGIGEAFIGNIFLDDIPAGKVKVLSDQWWGLVEHAIREGGRVGVNVGMFNCPGWSQSGGPWVKPEQAMRYLVSSETRVQGPRRFEEKLPVPKEPFQDVAVLAIPAPRHDADSLAARQPKVTCIPPADGAENLVDGDSGTAMALPSKAGQGQDSFTIQFELAQPLTARSLSLIPADSPWAAQCELQAAEEDGPFRTVRSFKFDRSNMAIGVGPMPRGPVTVSLAPTTARQFRLVLSRVTGKPALAEVELSAAARVESFVEKQLGKMHPTPLPLWDTYLWPSQPEPESAELTVAPGEVVNLTDRLATDGTLRWDVPPGEWILIRTGMTPTGTRNSPASPEGQGLEIDKMNREAAKAHFDAFIGQVLQRMPAADRKAFRRVIADSYEMGPQNWTNGFGKIFRQRYGYDPTPWLPVLTGRVVGTADQSDRFLWDLRRLVADHVAKDYVGGLRDLCRDQGMELWLENYGHWGFPAEFLQYGGQSDRLGGEFWVTGDLGSIECRAATSAANTYGMPVVSAEAFTGGPPFQTMPWGLKARGDWAFCEGVNHFVLHVLIQQPWEDRKPGVNAWFGTEFNRHNTWFEHGRAWIDYLRRCCFLLQQGTRVADVAYFIGEDAPKMTGIRQPELPAGCDFDYINAEVIQERLAVKDGRLVLPHGTTYRVLVLPELPTMRPELLRKLRDLVESGATVIGPPPSRSPSLENYPRCDEEVQRLAAELWGEGGHAEPGERRFGKGRVIWGKGLGEVFESEGVKPDFASPVRLRFTHRAAEGVDIYFVANPQAEEVATTVALRVPGKTPELWRPATGRIERAAVYEEAEGCLRMPIHLAPRESVFIVFREQAADAQHLVSVTRNGKPLLDTKIAGQESKPSTGDEQPAPGTFTMAVWVKPSAETTLPPEANRGAQGLGIARNDVLFPPHGESLGGPGHAGSGLAVGRNGVCIFEHGASYFAPVLVHAAPVTDWTHVAVVYRDGQPSLYLNGRFVHRGLKSTYTVHPGTGAAGAGPAPFRGEIGGFEHFPRVLSEAEIAELATTMPRPGARLAAGAIQLVRNREGGIVGRVWEPGAYVFKTARGEERKIEVDALPAPLELGGPWEVRFTPGWGAPEKATFLQLEDWTQRPEDGIRYYSGTAIYRKTFDLPGTMHGRPLCLELGTVRDLAVVRLNGRRLGTVWTAPWRVDITAAARSGSNALEIEVVNPWNNRLVGDAKLPPDQRRTFLAKDTLSKNAPLLPAGLLGPVTIRAAEESNLR